MGTLEFSSQDPYMEGCLQKYRNTRWPHIWQKRWFVLKGKELSWAKERGGKVLGTVQVEKLEWNSGAFTNPKELCFTSVQPNKQRTRSIELRAVSAAECSQWRSTLEKISGTGKPIKPRVFPPSPPRRPKSAQLSKYDSNNDDDDDDDDDEDDDDEVEKEDEDEDIANDEEDDKQELNMPPAIQFPCKQQATQPQPQPQQPKQVLEFLHQHDLRVQELRIACKDAFRIASSNSRGKASESDEVNTERSDDEEANNEKEEKNNAQPDIQGLLD
eukprot:CAMPEP_0196595440 /NCGR_PEP_ID=MMETSP1081-20130531/81102_1 /TAXON_ID=36882 /ORGANISM="Pyramimonas amylifera, Strain CCMP720" /LENGTH=271 /DNA_ID=CAMNT_0041920009 /DNA_START=201 /DNA_END=1016 /DNA_ORIENTATION=+